MDDDSWLNIPFFLTGKGSNRFTARSNGDLLSSSLPTNWRVASLPLCKNDVIGSLSILRKANTSLLGNVLEGISDNPLPGGVSLGKAVRNGSGGPSLTRNNVYLKSSLGSTVG